MLCKFHSRLAASNRRTRGGFIMMRKMASKRLRAKLSEVKERPFPTATLQSLDELTVGRAGSITRQRPSRGHGGLLTHPGTGAGVSGMKTCTELRLPVMLDTVP